MAFFMCESISTFIFCILDSLSFLADEITKYEKIEAENIAIIESLLTDLHTTASMSFAVPIAFRIIHLAQHRHTIEQDLDFEDLATNKDKASKMQKIKVEMLSHIEQAINGHWLWILKIKIKFLNIDSRLRKYFSRFIGKDDAKLLY